MEREYFVRRHSDGEIVNCVSSSQPESDVHAYIAKTWPDCYGDTKPPLSVLKRYEFWDARP